MRDSQRSKLHEAECRPPHTSTIDTTVKIPAGVSVELPEWGGEIKGTTSDGRPIVECARGHEVVVDGPSDGCKWCRRDPITRGDLADVLRAVSSEWAITGPGATLREFAKDVIGKLEGWS